MIEHENHFSCKEELPPRKGGQLRGLILISEDFDDPLPQELLDAFLDTHAV